MEKVVVLCVLKPKAQFDDFGVAELCSLMEIEEVNASVVEWQANDIHKMKYFISLRVQHDHMAKLQNVIDRSIMIRTFIELYQISEISSSDAIKNAFEQSEKLKEELTLSSTYCFLITAEFHRISYTQVY